MSAQPIGLGIGKSKNSSPNGEELKHAAVPWMWLCTGMVGLYVPFYCLLRHRFSRHRHPTKAVAPNPSNTKVEGSGVAGGPTPALTSTSPMRTVLVPSGTLL